MPLKKLLDKWKSWINPVLMAGCFYMLIRLGLSEGSFFIKTIPDVGQGEIPTVTFEPAKRLLLALFLFVMFNVFLFQALRQWARYYLNRKLVLSYLLFAIIPLLTNLFIFTAGIKTWLGISTTFIVEKAMVIQKNELTRFVKEIQDEVLGIESSDLNFEKMRKILNDLRTRTKAGSRFEYLDTATIPIEAYWLTRKYPRTPRYLVPLLEGTGDSLLAEETETYEDIYPSWLNLSQWTNIVSYNETLYIRHFSLSPAHREGRFLIVASIPIDRRFLNKLKEFQTVRMTIRNKEGSQYVSSDESTSPWYARLFLSIFSNERSILALNWDSGKYEEYGEMTFEIEPSEISRILTRDQELTFFFGEEQRSSLRFIVFVGALLVLGVLIAIVFGIYLISYITRSMNVIADGHERVRSGQLQYRLPFIGKDQLGSMGRSFNSMINSIESLMNQVAEKQKYQEELRIARDIQMSLLPDVEGLDWCNNISASCIPARDVGGDYYEILQVEDGIIGVFIADVSGKGASAAFYMAELKGILIALKHLWSNPNALMLKLNEILKPALASNVFISGAYLLLDPVVKQGQLARAGHCPSFLVKSSGEVVEMMPPGIALGIADNKVFGKILEVAEFQMDRDDKIILYTDGLDEMTFHDQMYGVEKLKEVLRKNGGLNADMLKNAILEDVLGFLSSEAQNDDLTLVVAGLPKLANRRPETLEAAAPSGANSSDR